VLSMLVAISTAQKASMSFVFIFQLHAVAAVVPLLAAV
jgi:hypothetical protein